MRSAIGSNKKVRDEKKHGVLFGNSDNNG